MRSLSASVLVYLVYLSVQVKGLDNGLALTPPMGWLSWERFRCTTNCKDFPDECISEKLIMTMADLMKSGGYLQVGYDTIIIDDCWAEKDRDVDGRLVADASRFPRGIPFLAHYVHKLGLKFGIYGDYGTKTCGGYPGTMDYEGVDAQTFAEWGVDYVKLDGCYSSEDQRDKGYPLFGDMLNKTNRPIIYSCSWPAYASHSVYDLLPTYCNLWRNFDDIQDSWDSVLSIVDHFNNMSIVYTKAAGPGHWNDPDMLIIGNFGLSMEQSKSQMAIWAIFAAPLIMSNDLRSVPSWAADILQNKDIIAVNQDSLGIMGKLIKKIYKVEIYCRLITPVVREDFSQACVFMNRGVDGTKVRVTFTPSQLGMNSKYPYIVKDLFTSETLGQFGLNDHIHADIAPTGAVMYRFIVTKPKYSSSNEISKITVTSFDDSRKLSLRRKNWFWNNDILY